MKSRAARGRRPEDEADVSSSGSGAAPSSGKQAGSQRDRSRRLAPPHSLGEFLSQDAITAGQLGIGLGKPVHRRGITHDSQGLLKRLQVLRSDKDR